KARTSSLHQGACTMSAISNRLALPAPACAVPAPAAAQLLERKDLSYAIAHTVAENALADCKNRGYAVSVVVVDRGGNTVVALRADNASVHTMENARRKAYTAMTFKMTTADFIKDMATRPVRREQTTLPNVIAIDGGVPIKIGNDVIGGVGLSGSPGVDEQCVMAGMNKVKDQLQLAGETTTRAAGDDEARDIRDRQDLRAGEAARDVRSEEGAGDRREHLAGGPAGPDPGAAGRRPLRPGGRAASVGGVQEAGRADHQRIPRAGAPALARLRLQGIERERRSPRRRLRGEEAQRVHRAGQFDF